MRIALDTGGTFTDCVYVHDGRLEVVKVFSTPRNPAQAISDALDRIQLDAGNVGPLDLICGTTVGTNALLERRGGRVTLVTTAGFEDVLEIGRQARPRLYDFFVERPAPLVPAARRLGLRERVAADGTVLRRPGRAELLRTARRVAASRADAVAICLLFSFVNPRHERALARELRRRKHLVSVSHEILPELREFERTSTTVVNAYLAPVMGHYLAEIETRSSKGTRGKGRPQVRVMQSNGGIISVRAAAREPVRTILSGPAGGVVGAQYMAELSGFSRIVGFDMGGTSTDAALLAGQPAITNEATVAGLPVAAPVLDIHTVGAGGGSLARFDRAGALRVGPESAGADPGPICYGRGEQPTVTDAHVVLGRIPPQKFLGGSFRLDEERTRRWFARVLRAAPRPLRSVEALAEGIVAVANATMEKAIRVISVERGHDPRDYSLVAFGGAGGLHACELAAAMDMPRVILPRFPGALSALGILRADVVRDFSRTVQLALENPRVVRATLASAFSALRRLGERELAAEGFVPPRVHAVQLLDLRYAGQAFDLTVAAAGDFVRAFHAAHLQRYGYADPQRAVEIVNVRLRLTGRTPKPALPRRRPGPADARSAISETRRMIFAGRTMSAAVYDRAALRSGHAFRGPAIITEYSATSVLPPGWRARVDAVENILLERAR
jgi:N-methylhydantoinase A